MVSSNKGQIFKFVSTTHHATKEFKNLRKKRKFDNICQTFFASRKTCQNKNGFLLQIQVEDSPPQRGQQGDLVQAGGALQVEEGFQRQIRIQLTGR